MAKHSSLNADLMRIIGAIPSTVIRLGPPLHSRDRSSQPVFRLDDVEISGLLEGIPL